MNELVVIQKIELESLIHNAVIQALQIVQNQKPQKDKMSVEEAAKYLNLSVATINRLKDSGKIAFSKLGKRVIIEKKELDRYNEKNKSTATQTATYKKVS